MKKELFAALLLIIIFVGSFINIKVLTNLSNELISLVDEAEALAAEEKWSDAASIIESSVDIWTSKSSYMQIVLHHSEIEETADDFYSMLSEIYSEDYGSVKTEAATLRYKLNCIVQKESIDLGSIM